MTKRAQRVTQGDLAQLIGRWSHEFSPSPERLQRIKASIRDFVGCVIAGTRRPELRSALWLAHGGGVPVWGLADSFDGAGAALVTGTAGSLLQLHDFYAPGASHPSSPVIAAAWAALHSSQSVKSSDGFAYAVAAGYEAANRISEACMAGQVRAGTTPTALSGAIGAAVAAALIGGLDAAGVGRSVSNAALLAAATPIAALRTHGALVPMHAGLAARAGYEAASLGRDADAGGNVLEGDGTCRGWIDLLGGDVDGIQPRHWCGGTIDDVGWKFFPACFGSHVALEAVLRMERFDTRTIRRVNVKQSARLLDMLIESGPAESHLYDRLMSLRWVMARALEDHAFEYPAAVADNPSTSALAAKIHIGRDAALDETMPGILCATIEVHSAAGVRRIHHRRPAKGDPEDAGPRGWSVNPDRAALLRKFATLSNGYASMSQGMQAMGIAS